MRKGFTLIELLVVISILGILATLVFVSFSTSQKQARDTQRKSDLRQFATALENFANLKSGLYPSRLGVQRASSTLCADLGLTGCPVDPKYTTDSSYDYKYTTDGSGTGQADAAKYVLWAKLEGLSSYWVVCSTGKSGAENQAGWTDPSAGTCPL